MKVVILAGGLGTRISEETDFRPKPLVEVGGLPIIWHIMKIYSAAGLNDFVVCCGYKGIMLKRFFSDYYLGRSDVLVDLAANTIEYKKASSEPWRVMLVDTGDDTMTGGRLGRVRDYLEDQTFCLTYGDGVADLDLSQVVAFHKSHGKLATVTAVPSPGRFGILDLDGQDNVSRFHEKPNNEMGWINGGFFVLEPRVLDYVESDATIWERGPLERLAADQQLAAYRHSGFWKPMDTLRDRRELEDLWKSGRAPWKRW